MQIKLIREDPIRERDKRKSQNEELKEVTGKIRSKPKPPSLSKIAAKTMEPSTGAST